MKRALLLSAAALALLPACGGGSDATAPAGPQPDFSLLDANTASASAGTNVSPRDFLGMVPAFYFGNAG